MLACLRFGEVVGEMLEQHLRAVVLFEPDYFASSTVNGLILLPAVLARPENSA